MSQLDEILSLDNKPAPAEPEVLPATAALSTAQVVATMGTLGMQLDAAVHIYNSIPQLNGDDVYGELTRIVQSCEAAAKNAKRLLANRVGRE